jgi:1,2-diacylglycerol 3-beta-glucosyltransferase
MADSRLSRLQFEKTQNKTGNQGKRRYTSNMRNRIILIGLIVAVWLGLKVVDCLFTGPELLLLLVIGIAIMVTHSVWLLNAQHKWRKRRNLLAKTKSPVSQALTLNAAGAASQSLSSSISESVWEPWIDIFIAAKNEARVIENTVRNTFKINYDKLVVWVIDDCSTDATADILEKLQGEFPRLRLIKRAYGSQPGKSAALNEALPLSKGEVIAVFDADAYVAPDFFQLMLPVLEPEGIGAVQAQKRIYEYQKGFLVNCQASEYALDTYFQIGRDLIRGAVELRGNGQLVKRAALIDVGGWNNKAITDDLDLSMRLLVNHWDIRFCPHAYVWEEGVTTLKALMRQRCRWAEGSIRRYLDYIFPLNSPTRLSLVERLDTIAFTVLFVVPALMLLEVTSELIHFSTGLPTHGRLFAIICMIIYLISELNIFVAIKIYRNMSFWRTFVHSLGVSAYIYLHWIPCIVISVRQIIFGKQASTWHPTEHVGHSAAN